MNNRYNMVKQVSMLSILIVCFSSSVAMNADSSEAKDDFTVQRPQSGLHSRQQLRERLAEILSEYLELLAEEVSLIAKRLLLCDASFSAQEHNLSKKYMRTLCDAQQFLSCGNMVNSEQAHKKGVPGDVKKLYLCLIDEIACTQRELMKVLRCLLERDSTSCFVACKAKSQLERYVQQARNFTRLALEQNDYLRTIVQNF